MSSSTTQNNNKQLSNALVQITWHSGQIQIRTGALQRTLSVVEQRLAYKVTIIRSVNYIALHSTLGVI